MRKILLLFFCFVIHSLTAQEVQEVYKFKEENVKRKFLSGKTWNYLDLDSLTLLKNQNFHRVQFYRYHEIRYTEFKGTWKIENDTLKLSISEFNESQNKKDWIKQEGILKYKLRNIKLIPINGYQFSAFKNLIRIE